MAQNNLTPEQDLLVREFYAEVAVYAEGILTESASTGRRLRNICLTMLNYIQLPNGAFVDRATKISMPFGSSDYSAYEDEWQADFDAAVAAVAVGEGNEATNDTDTSEASTSESTSNTSVRKAVLSKDV